MNLVILDLKFPYTTTPACGGVHVVIIIRRPALAARMVPEPSAAAVACRTGVVRDGPGQARAIWRYGVNTKYCDQPIGVKGEL